MDIPTEVAGQPNRDPGDEGTVDLIMEPGFIGAIIPQTELAKWGSYSVGKREGLWFVRQGRRAAGGHKTLHMITQHRPHLQKHMLKSQFLLSVVRKFLYISIQNGLHPQNT